MTHATTRVQQRIGDPVSDKPPLTRAKVKTIFLIQSDLRYDHERNGCLNCGICTATCPAADYYDFSPRESVQLLWIENFEGIYDAMQEKIRACAQCYTCAAHCPLDNAPGGLIMLMRETAIKHNTESVRNVLRRLRGLGRGQVNAAGRHLGGRSVRGEDEYGRLRRMCLRTPCTALVSAI